MLTFYFSGANGVLSEPETLTSGMTGKEVAFRFSRDWIGLGKVAVFTAGAVTRDVILTEDVAVIPWEVLQIPMQVLYVGVYGVAEGGDTVIPTVRVKGPVILPGADPSGDPGLEVTPQMWEQVAADLVQLRQEIQEMDFPVEGLAERDKELLLSLFRQTAYTADASEILAELENRWSLDAGVPEEPDAPDTPDTPDEPETPHAHSYTASVTRQPSCTQTGERTYSCACGTFYRETIDMTDHQYANGVCTVCGAADPDYVPVAVLTGISASYSGGEVEEGTALEALTGLTVTASFSDGSSAALEEYTLSGSIQVGNNTVTVTYEGMQTSFTVVGTKVAEPVLIHNWDLTQSLTDTVGGRTATITGYNMYRNENGLVSTADQSYCYFGNDLFKKGRTIEIDVVTAVNARTSLNGYPFMFRTENGVGKEGLSLRHSPYRWQIYTNAWQPMLFDTHDGTELSGKTAKFTRTADNVFSVYFGDTLIGTTDTLSDAATELQVGSSPNNFYNLTISAIRVYEGVK